MFDSETPLLSFDHVVAGYDKLRVLNEVCAEVHTGEFVAIIGRNGAGKSTLLKTIFGILPLREGRILLNGVCLPPEDPHIRIVGGIGYVPQGGRVFGNMTVHENLKLGGSNLSHIRRSQNILRVLATFPKLKRLLNHRACTLSGGERQLVAIATTLVRAPQILLLDEPSLGLPPSGLAVLFESLQAMRHETTITVLIVEQRIQEVLRVAQRAWILKNGSLSYDGSAVQLQDTECLRSHLL